MRISVCELVRLFCADIIHAYSRLKVAAYIYSPAVRTSNYQKLSSFVHVYYDTFTDTTR